MRRPVIFLGCLALLAMPAAASAETPNPPLRLVTSSSGGASGTGGYSDTGAKGSESGANDNIPQSAKPDSGAVKSADAGHKKNGKKHKPKHSASAKTPEPVIQQNVNTSSGNVNTGGTNQPAGHVTYGKNPAGTSAPK